MAENPFGWDLFFNSIKNDVKSNQDLLVSLVHFTLVSNGFKCIGLGESKVLTGDELKSENLPEGWRDNYTIRYIYQGVLYNLKGTSIDDAIMVNLIRVQERNVSFIQLNTRAVVKRSGSLNEMIPDYPAMMEVIKKQLIDTVIISNKARDTSTQTASPQNVVEVPRSTTSNSHLHSNSLYEDRDYWDTGPVGRNDLDPFGIDPLRITRPNRNSGGGMLFQPPGGFGSGVPFPSGMPPGAVPPGARFDPFRPPDVDRWNGRRPRRPDNDELPPPGYDDMFM
ncbi:hypothetical protein WA026_006368 [Henosepilachna vigintioctopunctata]|uniref:Proteasome inhibitor PI31 subunit n=1 Tax=Henosepilachna vigintioctopunctata TaxID=420089 RepID=A0AAW1TI89_9CUCU